MSSWGRFRSHCQWMALLSCICTESEFEHSDNHLWHLRYRSSAQQMGQYLLTSSPNHWKGHLSLLSDLMLQWPYCSWAVRTPPCIYELIFLSNLYCEQYFEWVLTKWLKRKKNPAVRCTRCQLLIATHGASWQKKVAEIFLRCLKRQHVVQQNHFFWSFSLQVTCYFGKGKSGKVTGTWNFWRILFWRNNLGYLCLCYLLV